MSARTDVHRPGAILPTDYVYIMSYSLPSNADMIGFRLDCSRMTDHDMSKPHRSNRFSGESICPSGDPCPPREHSANGTCCVHRMIVAHPFFTTQGNIGKCSVCGASYLHGDVWFHAPTNEHIHVGHECADKYQMFASRSEWATWHKEQTRLRAIAAKEKRFKVAALRFLERTPGLREALELGDPAATDARLEPIHEPSDAHQVSIRHMDPACPLCNALRSEGRGGQRTKYLTKAENDQIFAKVTLADMEFKLNKYGSLSEKQVAFALRLAAQASATLAPVAEERHVAAPSGRVQVTGTVVSVKVHDNDFGSTLKMTVKVETPDGSWLVWTTVPAQITGSDLKGKTVQFTATLSAGNQPHFAFGKRPTSAAVLERS